MSARLRVLAPLLLAAGCAEPVPGDRVQHLDLRLADGTSATEHLAAARRVVREWTFTSPEDLRSPWRLDDARAETTDGGEGLWIVGTTPDETRLKRIALHFLQPTAAPLFDLVEVDLARTRAGVTRFSWVAADAPEPAPTPTGFVDVVHDDTEGPTTVRIPLAGLPEWRGEMRALRFAPNAVGPQFFELRAVRFVREGFQAGVSPLAEGLDGAASADGGLVARGPDARRAWPTDWSVPLFARDVRLPEGARVSVAATLRPGARPRDAAVELSVRLRGYDGVFHPVATRRLEPGEPAGWVQLSADLSERAGDEVDLQFAASYEGGPTLREARLARASVLFGEPIVYGTPPSERWPNVVLVTLDTTRADVVEDSLWGADTPFLDALAERSLVFRNHWSASNSTSPSHASLLTGLALQDHGVVANTSRLAAENVTLTEVLRHAGWQTAAAVSVDHLRAERSGLGQGFDRFLGAPEGSPRDGAITLEPTLAWLDEWSAEGDRPFFLWLHLFDPHTPYAPPDELLDELARAGRTPPPRVAAEATIRPSQFTAPGQFLDGVTNLDHARFLYAAGVSYADRLTARLWERIESLGLADDTIFVVTSDHGEALGEHDVWFVHSGLYEEVLRVPLLVAVPGGPIGAVDALTWSLDVPRTLLELVGERPLPEMRGANLLDVAAGAGPADRRLWLEHSHLVAVAARDARWHFVATLDRNEQLGPHRVVEAGTRELYDHRVDRDLAADRAADSPDDLEALERALEAWRASALDRERLWQSLTPEERDDLRALGYAGD